MFTTTPDTADLDRRHRMLDSRYRTASLQLDLARLEYYQLMHDTADAARIDRAKEKVLDLTQQRDALRAELERLEDFH